MATSLHILGQPEDEDLPPPLAPTKFPIKRPTPV